MVEMMIGVTVLIPMILILRWLTKGKVSMEFRYALWLAVALRLMIPMSFGNSPYSVTSMVKNTADYLTEEAFGGLSDDSAMDAKFQSGGQMVVPGEDMAGGKDVETDEAGNSPEIKNTVEVMLEKPDRVFSTGTDKERSWNVNGWLLIWFAGFAAVGGYMLTGQIHFVSYLRRTGQEVSPHDLPKMWTRRIELRKMHVCLVQDLPVPCMVGRSIYLGPQLWEDKDKLAHVLAHEYAHAVQWDSLWALVRSILCAVYWFHPLVWAAAYMAKQDSELACDEKAVRMLGEKERFAYGRTLLEVVSDQRRHRDYEGIVLTMGGSGRRMKERIMMIAGKKKKSKVVTVFAVCVSVVMCGCTFMGIETSEKTGSSAEESTKQAEEKESLSPKMAEAAESIEQGEEKKISQRLDEIEAEEKKVTETEFGSLITQVEDDALASASAVDMAGYFDYLYEGGECPLEDWTWYLLGRNEEADISFYGLYTQQYGMRGLGMMIHDDVNTFDLPWMPSYLEPGVEVLEWAEDGVPRTFAFQLLRKEDGRHEIWQLYLADRYDTGTVDLYAFDDYGKQFQDMIELRVNQEAQEVEMICQGETVGTIDISKYADYTVEEAVWDGSGVSFLPNSYLGVEDFEPVAMVSSIGLILSETDEIQYRGLAPIVCPVDVGTWGERSFTLGTPRVDERYGVNGILSTLE